MGCTVSVKIVFNDIKLWTQEQEISWPSPQETLCTLKSRTFTPTIWISEKTVFAEQILITTLEEKTEAIKYYEKVCIFSIALMFNIFAERAWRHVSVRLGGRQFLRGGDSWDISCPFPTSNLSFPSRRLVSSDRATPFYSISTQAAGSTSCVVWLWNMALFWRKNLN